MYPDRSRTEHYVTGYKFSCWKSVRYHFHQSSLPSLLTSFIPRSRLSYLDLGHSRASAGSAAAQVGTSATGSEDRENQRAHKAGPGEPEEGSRGLAFTAALFPVAGVVGHIVVEEVLLLFHIDG